MFFGSILLSFILYKRNEDLKINTGGFLPEAITKDYAIKDNLINVALEKPDNKAELPATIFTYSLHFSHI